MKILDNSEHISSPRTYNKSGAYSNEHPQPTNNRPLTCREREYLLDEIDYWQRAYEIACERRERDHRDSRARHQKIIDFIVLVSFSIIALVMFLTIIMTTVDWMIQGWR